MRHFMLKANKTHEYLGFKKMKILHILLLKGIFLLSLCGHSSDSSEEYEPFEEPTFEELCLKNGIYLNKFPDPIYVYAF